MMPGPRRAALAVVLAASLLSMVASQIEPLIEAQDDGGLVLTATAVTFTDGTTTTSVDDLLNALADLQSDVDVNSANITKVADSIDGAIWAAIGEQHTDVVVPAISEAVTELSETLTPLITAASTSAAAAQGDADANTRLLSKVLDCTKTGQYWHADDEMCKDADNALVTQAQSDASSAGDTASDNSDLISEVITCSKTAQYYDEDTTSCVDANNADLAQAQSDISDNTNLLATVIECSKQADHFWDVSSSSCKPINPVHEPADFVSDGWLAFRAQAGTASFMEISHGLGVVPERVRVLVRGKDTESDSYFIFESSGAAICDDECHQYGGVVSAADDNRVRLWAPDASNAGDQGALILVHDGWGGEKHDLFIKSGHVKVYAWKKWLPRDPDFVEEFNFASQNGDASYKEFAHNLNDPLPHKVQVRCSPTDSSYVSEGDNAGFWFEGRGAAGIDDDNQYHQHGGFVFAYDANRLRVWAPTKNNDYSTGHLIFVDDGWGGEVNDVASHHAKCKASIWKSTDEDPKPTWQSEWRPISARAGQDSYKYFGFGPSPGIPSRVQVLTRAIDGNNVGFIFEGIHSTIDDDRGAYGGVAFGYDDHVVRIWAADANNGAAGNAHAILVSDGWGNEINQQASVNAEYLVRVWA